VDLSTGYGRPDPGPLQQQHLAARDPDDGRTASHGLLLPVAGLRQQTALHTGRARGVRQGVGIFVFFIYFSKHFVNHKTNYKHFYCSIVSKHHAKSYKKTLNKTLYVIIVV